MYGGVTGDMYLVAKPFPHSSPSAAMRRPLKVTVEVRTEKGRRLSESI